MNSKILAWNIRRDVLDMVHAAHASHIGSAFSVADIIAVLYTDFVDKKQLLSGDKERSRIILSKGHAGAAIYAALAEIGLMDKKELQTYGTNGSKLSCHVSHGNVNGVEISTGSLGQGVGMAAGIALAGKKAGLNYRTFVIAGDGECNEGSVWEEMLISAALNAVGGQLIALIVSLINIWLSLSIKTSPVIYNYKAGDV